MRWPFLISPSTGFTCETGEKTRLSAGSAACHLWWAHSLEEGGLLAVTGDHQIQSIGLTERTTYNVGRVGDASPNTASAALCNPAKKRLALQFQFLTSGRKDTNQTR